MTGTAGTLPPVSATALGVAAVRATETGRPDRLFADPMAAAFLRHAGWTPPGREGGARSEPRRRLTAWVVARTRFLDDVVRHAGAAGCRQAVILGAGLDSRAFRLRWPDGTQLFELDLPEMIAFKASVVEAEGWRPRCRRVAVAVDLEDDWTVPLRAAAFDPAVRTVWLAEGLLAYLSPGAADAVVAGSARLSPAGSRLGLTLARRQRLEEWRRRHPDGSPVGTDPVALWRSASPEDARAWLEGHGWRAAVTSAREVLARSGRLPEPPAAAVDRPGADEAPADGSARLVAARRSGPRPPGDR